MAALVALASHEDPHIHVELPGLRGQSKIGHKCNRLGQLGEGSHCCNPEKKFDYKHTHTRVDTYNNIARMIGIAC